MVNISSKIGQKSITARPAVIILLLIVALSANPANSQVVQDNPKELQGVDIEEHLDEKIPLDLVFTDDYGQEVRLDNYFNKGKPVILILGYYTCPMLCNLVFNGLRDAILQLDWAPGDKFQILTVSIDPRETDLVASAKKKNYIKSLGMKGIDNGWIFMTGSEENSKALADAVGFKYYFDEKQDQYAHPAAIYILTPDGTISKYFYGIEFNPRDLKFALIDASEGKIGSTLDRIILSCYHYDPDSGSYSVLAGNVMRLGGAVTLVFLGLVLGFFWFREHRKKNRT